LVLFQFYLFRQVPEHAASYFVNLSLEFSAFCGSQSPRAPLANHFRAAQNQYGNVGRKIDSPSNKTGSGSSGVRPLLLLLLLRNIPVELQRSLAQRTKSDFLKYQYYTNFLNPTMDFSSDASAKLNLTISTGNIFSGNTTNVNVRRPQAKGLFQIGQPIPPQFQRGRQF
jgi:hypothetical protein